MDELAFLEHDNMLSNNIFLTSTGITGVEILWKYTVQIPQDFAETVCFHKISAVAEFSTQNFYAFDMIFNSSAWNMDFVLLNMKASFI